MPRALSEDGLIGIRRFLFTFSMPFRARAASGDITGGTSARRALKKMKISGQAAGGRR